MNELGLVRTQPFIDVLKRRRADVLRVLRENKYYSYLSEEEQMFANGQLHELNNFLDLLGEEKIIP